MSKKGLKVRDKGPVVTQTQLISAAFSGPLPLPAHLRDYEAVLPGAADRILKMAEDQSAHRQDLERRVTKHEGRRAWAGLLVAGCLAGGCIGGGVWLASTGQPTAGASIATFSVATLAGVFIYGTQSRRAERIQRAAMRPRSR